MTNHCEEFEKAKETNNDALQIKLLNHWLTNNNINPNEFEAFKQSFIKHSLAQTKSVIFNLYYNENYEKFDLPNYSKQIVNLLSNSIGHKFYIKEIVEIFEQTPEFITAAKMKMLFNIVRAYSNMITLPETTSERHEIFQKSLKLTLDAVSTDKGSNKASLYIAQLIKENEDFLFSSKTAKPYFIDILNSFKIPISKSNPNWIYKVKKVITIENLLLVGYDKTLQKNEKKAIEYLSKLAKNSSHKQFEAIFGQVKFSPLAYQELATQIQSLYGTGRGEISKNWLSSTLMSLEKNILENNVSTPSNQKEKKIKL